MAAMAEGGAVVRQGHLRKLKTMKKKYFVLRAETSESSARLEYYESEKKFRSGAAPRRVLPLKSCYNITRRLDLKQKHVIALFTKEEQLCIVAENEQDLHGWLAAILKQFRTDDASEELLHPIQHVWQVNVQKKGLGVSKNIQGLYNLCLTDKTLALVKIKSHNNVISDLVIPERVEYSLKNIRRCGDSECFFYMEVGRQTATGAGELWMHSDDSNIAQSMHSTIYHAMINCAKETENEKDHVVIPSKGSLIEGSNSLPTRPRTYSDVKARVIYNDKGLCVGSCIKQCVCASATYSIDDSCAAIAPLTPKNADQPTNNTLTPDKDPARIIKHHRTVSLPAGYLPCQEPLRIVHERTRSAPLTGDELDRAILEKVAMHSSCKAVNGTDGMSKKTPWSRRASTGTRLSKLSPAHTKNTNVIRKRCDTMPSRASSSFEPERPPPRDVETDGLDSSRDDIDSISEWYRTPRIPEEPDCCDHMAKDFMSMTTRGSSSAHSRTSSVGADEVDAEPATPAAVGTGSTTCGPLGGFSVGFPGGYLPMAPGHEPLAMASSGSVCSGTPSTDPRFSEYQLDPATAHISAERSTRAYSVGSRPLPARVEPARMRAYSAGARRAPRDPATPAASTPATPATPVQPRASAGDWMELDFSSNSPAPKVVVARTPPGACFLERRNLDEYVDMSPRNAGYVEMRPGDLAHATLAPSTPAPATPDGYVEMTCGRAPTRPIAISTPRQPPPLATSPDERRRRREPKTPLGSQTLFNMSMEPKTPLGSQTLFHMSMESPSSPPETDIAELDDDHHYLTTVRELSEDGRKSPELRAEFKAEFGEVSSSPQYVQLVGGINIAKGGKKQVDELPSNPTAAKTIVRPDDVRETSSIPGTAVGTTAGGVGGAVHYAALDLEPRRALAAPAQRLYTQIDFVRSEKYAADAT